LIPLITQRVGQALIVLTVVSVLAFILSAVVGDPVASILGINALPEDREALRLRLGLDDPAVYRYLEYIGNAIRGEFGISWSNQRPVADLLKERVPATLELAFTALLMSLLIGLPVGIFAALRRGRWDAGIALTLTVIGVSIPTFVTAILLIFGFSVHLGWLPSFGRGETVDLGGWSTGFLTSSGRASLVMPATALAIGQVALLARLVRAEMIEVLRSDYIRFAHARGLHPSVVNLSHALRNTLIPVITVSGIQLGFLFAFAIVAEVVFQWPGVGLLFIQALGATDAPVISAVLLVTALFFTTVNLIVDLLYVLVDPRLSHEEGGVM
jgi:peptide/nickel transport system permease protein